jgi:hypothetical protein
MIGKGLAEIKKKFYNAQAPGILEKSKKIQNDRLSY